jgi:hypothetical protein
VGRASHKDRSQSSFGDPGRGCLRESRLAEGGEKFSGLSLTQGTATAARRAGVDVEVAAPSLSPPPWLDPCPDYSVINVTLNFKRRMINGPKIPGTPKGRKGST